MATLLRKLKAQDKGSEDDLFSDHGGRRDTRRSQALSMADSSTLGEARPNYRAPDPTQGKGVFSSKRGVATVNLKRRGLDGNTIHRKSSMKSVASKNYEDPPEPASVTRSATLPRQTMKNMVAGTLGRKKKNRKFSLTTEDFGAEPKRMSHSFELEKKPTVDEPSSPNLSRRPNANNGIRRMASSATLERNVDVVLNGKSTKKRTFKAEDTRKTSAITEGTDNLSKTNSQGSSKSSQRNKRTMSLSPNLQNKVKKLGKNFFKGVYKRSTSRSIKDVTLREDDHTVEYGFGDADVSDLIGEHTKMKLAMEQKYQSLRGSYGFDSQDMYLRKESSFSMDSPMVLLLGRSKAGKSTVFKQLLSLAGAPPNYARAYVATKTPVEKDVKINDADLKVVDVGGSKKDVVDWRLYLTSAEVIIYVVALDEYDKFVPLSETGTLKRGQNKPRTYLQESLDLFDSIISNGSLLNSKFILLFNKADRFKKRLEEKKMSLFDVKAYENAPTSCDYGENLEYIKKMFLEKTERTEQDIQVEVTSAIDAEKCSEVLNKLTSRMVKSKDVTKWKNLL